MSFMIKSHKKLFISIVIHLFVLISTLYVWDNYVRTPDKQVDNTKLNSLSATATKKEITLSKEEVPKPDPEQKEIQKNAPKPITEEKIKPEIIKDNIQIKEKQKREKVVKKHNLEPKNMGIFLVEEVPHELAYIGQNKPPKTKSIKKIVIEKKQATKTKKVIKTKKQIKQQKAKEQIPYENIYLQVNEKKIAKLLKKHLFYTNNIRKKDIVGKVFVRFKLSTNKKIYDIRVIKSDNQLLNGAAMKTISDLSGKLPKPKKNMILNLPIEYKNK